MAYQYLKPSNLVEVFRASQDYTDKLTDKFPENERIARNLPHASIPKEYPKTTDGTTASIIRKTPHRVIQQTPTGKVKSVTDDWLAVVAEFIYTTKILPNANEGYGLLPKCWSVVENSLTFGSCATYTPFVEHYGEYYPDLRLPYWGDVFVQPGKLSDTNSNYVFLRSWWQTEDIDALIESQSKIDKSERTWDVENLKRIKKMTTTKDEKAKTPNDKDKGTSEATAVELITGFQRGVKAKFYTFHVASNLVVRTKTNKDPRGDIPISFAYGDIDGSNPLGRSIIELVAGLQNLMDAEMQMYQYNRALMLNPPLIKRGNFNKNRIKFVPNTVIDVGSDPNANVEALTIDSTAIANFPNNYGLMKSQMLNLLSSPDTSISAEVGNPGFSKTPQGVEASQANLSVDDNYVRKSFETWFERWAETAINMYFAERTGIEELQLDKKTVSLLESLAEEGKFDMDMLSEDNKIRINYDTATPALRFEVDASTSHKQDEVQQLQSYQGIVTLLDKSPTMQEVVPLEKQMALWNALVQNSGAENQEKLIVTDEDLKKIMEAQGQTDDIRDQIITNYKDAPEDIKRQIEAKNGFEPSQETSPVQQNIDQKNAQATQTDGQPEGLTAENVMAVHKQTHDQKMAEAKLDLEEAKIEVQRAQAETARITALKPEPKTEAEAKVAKPKKKESK